MCVRSRYGHKNITLKHLIMIITIRRSRRANERNCETWKLQSWMKNDDFLSVMHGSLRTHLGREHFSLQQWRSLKSTPSLLEYLHNGLLLIFERALDDEECTNWRRRTFPPEASLARKRKVRQFLCLISIYDWTSSPSSSSCESLHPLFDARVCSVDIFEDSDSEMGDVAWEFHQIGRDLNKRQVNSASLLKVSRNYWQSVFEIVRQVPLIQ